MNIDTATRAQLEAEIVSNDELCEFLGGLDKVQVMTTDELRERITEWIIEGSEV